MDTSNEEVVQYLPSDLARDTLGARMAWVRDTGGILGITVDGTPDGALVPPGLLAAAGLAPVSEQGVRQARAHWGAARTRATIDGPQGLTHHKQLLAVLVDQTTAAALTRHMPALTFEELELTGFALADGELVTPGEYVAHNGTTLRIHAPQEEEATVNDTTLFDPETPDEVIRETLAGTANRLVGAYMRATQAATTPEAKEEAKAKMRQTWQIKNDLDMGREEMIAEIQRLQGVLAEMREA